MPSTMMMKTRECIRVAAIAKESQEFPLPLSETFFKTFHKVTSYGAWLQSGDAERHASSSFSVPPCRSINFQNKNCLHSRVIPNVKTFHRALLSPFESFIFIFLRFQSVARDKRERASEKENLFFSQQT